MPNFNFGQNNTNTLNTLQRSEFFDLTKRIMVMQKDQIENGRSVMDLFKKMPIPEGTGTSRYLQEQDGDSFASLVGEQEAHPNAQSGSGYGKELKIKRYAIAVSISELAKKANQYREIYNKISKVMTYINKREILDLTHIFTFGASESYTDKDGYTVNITVGDGKSLVNTAHSLAFSSETYSNRLAGDPRPSVGAYELALDKLAINDIDNFGVPRNANDGKKYIICSSRNHAAMNVFKQILNSTADPSQNNSGVSNSYNNDAELMPLTYLDSDASGVNASTKRWYWGVVVGGGGNNPMASTGFEGYLMELSKEQYTWFDDKHRTDWVGATQYRDIGVLNGKAVVMSYAS